MGDGRPAIAMLGYGAVAGFHADALTASGGSIAVVAGPNQTEAAMFAARYAIPRVETDWREAIRSGEIVAVVIASPSHVHAEQVRLAIEARRHVLVEIPMALSAAESAELVEMAEADGLVLMACHTFRYWDTFKAARSVIDAGLQPLNIVARGLWRRHENVGWTGRRRTWTDDLLWHHGGHVLDAVLCFLGSDVEFVSAVAGPNSPSHGLLPMDYGITMRAVNGAIATVALSYNSLLPSSDFTIVGEHDAIVVNDTEVRVSSSGLIYVADSLADVERRAFQEQDDSFVRAVLTGDPPTLVARTILPTMNVLQRVHDLVGRG